MIQIDMEMPDSCRECWFLKYDMYAGETSCAIEDMIMARYFKALDFEGRHEECPLKDVPDNNHEKFTEDEKWRISDIFQSYYCMGIGEIAEESKMCKNIFQKVGLLDG